jgi:hypothetical protein
VLVSVVQSGGDGRVNWGAVHPWEFSNPVVYFLSTSWSQQLQSRPQKGLASEQPHAAGYAHSPLQPTATCACRVRNVLPLRMACVCAGNETLSPCTSVGCKHWVLYLCL